MLDREEAVEILEELAREGPDHVKVAAIRVLLRLSEEDGIPLTGFDQLYDEVGAKRRKKTAPRSE
jgi:hypothetical protein